MAPCNVSWNCDGVTGSTVLTSDTSVKFCSNGPPVLGGNCSSGTVVIINEGLCVGGQCEGTCYCYSVQNTGTTTVTVYYRNCITSAIDSVVMPPNDYKELCSSSIPADSTAAIKGVYAGACVNSICIKPESVNYYAIRVNNIFEYLEDPAAQDAHIQYVVCQGFTIYQIYGLYSILMGGNAFMQPLLSTFLTKLYNAGLKPVAILGALPTSQGGTGPDIYGALRTWENAGPGNNPDGQKFWGVNKECYFWNCPQIVCDTENEPFDDWVATLNWLRTGYGNWHNWHISCLVDVDPNAPWGAATAARIVAERPDVIEIRNEVDANTTPPPPLTIDGTPYPTYPQFTLILNLLQTAAANQGITNQKISVYWNAGFGYAGNFMATYPTHGPAFFDWQNVYDSVVAPTKPNLDMQGLTVYTYNSLVDAEPLCLPGYTTTTSTAGGITTTSTTVPPPNNFPGPYNKIFVLWLYNKGYRSIIGDSGSQAYSQVPYINQILRPQGTTFTGVKAQFNASQPNYLAAFAGDNFGVVNNNPWATSTPLNVHNNPNLFSALQGGGGRTFASYIQSIPSVGYQPPTLADFNVVSYYGYHDPAINFSNVTQSVRKDWGSFNPASAENVCFLIPDAGHNMDKTSTQATDNWLSGSSVVTSAVAYASNPSNNALFIIYADCIMGGDARLPVVFIGNNVLAGNTSPWVFPNGHYSFLRTLLKLNGINTPIGNIGSSDILVGWY